MEFNTRKSNRSLVSARAAAVASTLALSLAIGGCTPNATSQSSPTRSGNSGAASRLITTGDEPVAPGLDQPGLADGVFNPSIELPDAEAPDGATEGEPGDAPAEPPAENEPPLAPEQPGSIEPPINIEPPATIEPPVTVEPPLVVEPPVVVEPPATEPPATTEPPVAVTPAPEPSVAPSTPVFDTVDDAGVPMKRIPRDFKFPDVADDNQFALYIYWLVAKGITQGYTDGTFKPGNPVTRESIAAFLYRLAGSPDYTPDKVSFNDVPPDKSFYKEIEWLANTGITAGYADGGFHPGAYVNRQSIASFLYKAAGAPKFTAPNTPTFNDVPDTNPFYLPIEWLASTGITGGYADGGFHPTADVNREQIAAFLYRADEKGLLTFEPPAPPEPSQPCEWNPALTADDDACIPPVVTPEPMPTMPATPPTTPPTLPPCEWNPALDEDDPACIPPVVTPEPMPSMPATPPTTPPEPGDPVPTGLIATADDTFVTLNWNPVGVDNLAGYLVYRANAATGPWTKLTATPTTATEYTAANLVNGREYWFAVSSITKAAVESAKSDAVSATPSLPPDIVPPAVPTSVEATAGDQEVMVQWTPVPDDDADLAGYLVYSANSATGPWELLTPSSISDTYYLATDLTNDTEYWFAVSSVDVAGNESAKSAAVAATPVADGAIVEHCGNITINETWKAASVHQVTCNTTVATGATLTIEPGTVVKFGLANSSAAYGLTVNGTLDAQSNALGPIVFTSIKDDVFGGDTNEDGDATVAAPGSWSGISVRGTSDAAPASVIFDNVDVRYAPLNVYNSTTSTAPANDDRNAAYVTRIVSVLNSTFELGSYIKVDNSGPVIISNTSVLNHTAADQAKATNGINVTQYGYLSGTVLTGNLVETTPKCAISAYTYRAEAVGPVVTDNYAESLNEEPFCIRSNYLEPANFAYNSSGNGAWRAIRLTGQLVDNLTLPFGDLPITIGNGSGSAYTESGLTVGMGATLTVNPGTVVKAHVNNANYPRLTVNGALDVKGTAENPVVFTSIRDDSVGGDYNGDGNSSAAAPGDWGGIYVLTTATKFPSLNLDHMTLRYAPLSAVSSISTEAANDDRNSAYVPRIMSVTNSIFERGSSVTIDEAGPITVSGNKVINTTDAEIKKTVNGIEVTQYGFNSATNVSNNTVDKATSCGLKVKNIRETAVPVVTNNNAETLNAEPICIYSYQIKPENIAGNTSNNTAWRGIRLAGNIVSDMTLPFGSLPVTIGSTYGESPQGLTVNPGATLTVNPGTIVKAYQSSSTRLTVNGALTIAGTAENPVVFTSIRDDSVGGDYNGDGNSTAPTSSDWPGITVKKGATFESEGVDIRDAATALTVDSGVGEVSLHGRVAESKQGIYNYENQYVDATAVDWGAASGPESEDNPGVGATITGSQNVQFVPWVGYVPPERPATAEPQPESADARATACATYTLFGLRGSNDTPKATHNVLGSWGRPTFTGTDGFGTQNAAIATAFEKAISGDGATVKRVPIQYWALPEPLTGSWNGPGLKNYKDSIADGVDKLLQRMSEEVNYCPDSKFVIIGYDQGAFAAHAALGQLAQANVDGLIGKIAAVALVSDPARPGSLLSASYSPYTTWSWSDNGNDDNGADERILNSWGKWRSNHAGDEKSIWRGSTTTLAAADTDAAIAGKTLELCQLGDATCTFGMPVSESLHTSYSALTAPAGRWLACKAEGQTWKNGVGCIFDHLDAPGNLKTNVPMWSPNGTKQAILLSDGRLVVRECPTAFANCDNGNEIWESDSQGKGAVRFSIQTNGDLVLYTSANKNIWSSQSYAGGPGAETSGPYQAPITLRMQDDNNFVVYNGDGRAIWTSRNHPNRGPIEKQLDAWKQWVLNENHWDGYTDYPHCNKGITDPLNHYGTRCGDDGAQCAVLGNSWSAFLNQVPLGTDGGYARFDGGDRCEGPNVNNPSYDMEDNKKFFRCHEGPLYTAQPGDVVTGKFTNSSWGHVAVIIENNNGAIKMIDQNYSSPGIHPTPGVADNSPYYWNNTVSIWTPK